MIIFFKAFSVFSIIAFIACMYLFVTSENLVYGIDALIIFISALALSSSWGYEND